MDETTDINKMYAFVDQVAKSSKPTQKDLNQITLYIQELSMALDQINREKQKLVGEVESTGRTKQAHQLAVQGNKAIQALMEAQNNLARTHSNLQAEMQVLAESIDKERQVLNSNNSAFSQYANKIRDKMELLATRDRMLQLSQERNVYKKKVIYVLFAVIITLIVAGISVYTFLGKK